ncbi:putative retrotransposon hot spot (RHS) protein [Trypanosoma cruzi]|uniref:Putative retrotransposon hot spot (RHS) protein n=1 Tax=Trypanosoma cruzi TaxID=5693 RepID=A0A2V2WKT7_TRYCR|nr:putative retrotransposon hot spot (RHS) protein [Trypanosoma cruzi]RNC57269.1 retrotransposon hot spot (RHS) protein [Trypanosoma cruzi]
MAAGSFLLYQLLQYDAERLQMVVCFVGGSTTYVFNKTTQAVSVYMGRFSVEYAVDILSDRVVRGYVIRDAAEPDYRPSIDLSPSGWGRIAVSPSNVRNYREWRRQKGAAEIITNCPDEGDVRAMRVWMRCHRPAQERAEYWREVKGHMDEVGPLPSYIFDGRKYDGRIQQ